MKKALKWTLIAVGGLLAVLIILGVVLTAMIHEKRDITNPTVLAKNRDLQTVLNSHLQADLAPARETNEVEVLFSEEDLEFLFYAILREIDMPSGITLDGVDVAVENGVYTLAVSGTFGILPTVFRAGLGFHEENGNFSVTVEQASAGSLQLLKGLGKLIVRGLDAEKLESSLASVFLFCDIDLDAMTVTFTKENILRSVTALGGDDEDATLIRLLLDIFLDREEMLSFWCGEDNLLGAVLHLARLRYLAETAGTLPYTYDFDGVSQKVGQLLADEKITRTQVPPVFRLLVKGYSSLGEEDQAALDGLDLSSVGVTNVKTHRGIMEKQQRRLSELLSAEDLFLPSDITNPSFGLRITDDMLTEVLRGLDFVGYSMAFPAAESTEISYLVIEQFNFIARTDALDLQIIVNVNGVQIYLLASLTAPPSAGISLTGHLDTVCLGEETLTESQLGELLTYLTDVTEALDFMTVDPTEGTVTLHFEEQISSLAKLQELCQAHPVFTPKTVVVDGAITITYAWR